MEHKIYKSVIFNSDKNIVVERIEKANKKLAKMQGVDLITVIFDTVNDFDEESYDFNLMTKYEGEVSRVVIEYPVINNISGVDVDFVGTVNLEGCSETNKQYHLESEEHFQNIKGLELKCMHCGRKLDRKNYFVFQNVTSGEYLTLGSTCATNYFPFDVSRFMNIIHLTEEDINTMMDGNKHFVDYMDFDRVFDIIKVATNDFTKYYSVENAYGEEPTRDTIRFIDTEISLPESKSRYPLSQFFKDLDKTTCKKDVALELLVKYYGKENEKWTMFDYNVQSALFVNGQIRKVVQRKNIGIIAYALYHIFDLERKEVAKNIQRKADEVSTYFGNIGDKFKTNPIKVTITSVKSFETDFGTSTLITMVNAEHQIFVWWSSSGLDHKIMEQVSENKSVEVSIVGGSIKDHREYKGIKQTVITRCKLIA